MSAQVNAATSVPAEISKLFTSELFNIPVGCPEEPEPLIA